VTGPSRDSYTTVGSEPGYSSPVFRAPLTVDTTTTLKAKAFRADLLPSGTATGTYTISAGAAYSLALKTDGAMPGCVWAWGAGASGELGDGVTGTGHQLSLPSQVQGLDGTTAIFSAFSRATR
jgi:hypothetical protein